MKRKPESLKSGLLLALILFAVGIPPFRTEAQPTEVGIASAGHNALELIGRLDEDGANFTGYGYFSGIGGLPRSMLYTSLGLPSEQNAHFTYFTTQTLVLRNVIRSIFAVDTTGTLTIYYHDTPASFDTPTSFSIGTAIARFNLEYQSILNVQAPNVGVVTGIWALEQTEATPFDIGGQTYRLGNVGLVLRVFTTGEYTRTNAIIPQSFVVHAGNAQVAAGGPAPNPAALSRGWQRY